MQNLTIDFNKKADKVHRLEGLMFSVDAGKFFFRLLPREIRIRYYSIAIADLQIPEELQIKNFQSFIRLQYQQEGKEVAGNVLNNLKMDSQELMVNILLDESQVEDCLSPEMVYRGSISFNVAFTPEKGGKVTKHNIELDLTCLRADSSADYQLELLESFKVGHEYRGISDVEIGHIDLNCQSLYNFANPLQQCDLAVRFEDPMIKDAITFGWDTTINSRYSVRKTAMGIQVLNLVSNQQLRIPIVVDFSRFENPANRCSYSGNLIVEYARNGNIQPRSENFAITLTPDTKTAALFAEFSTGGEFRELKERELISEKYVWQGRSKSGQTNCFTFRLGNLAESGSGAVKIKDLQIDFSLDKDSFSPILAINEDWGSTNGKSRSLAGFFLVNGEKVDALPSNINLRNQVGGTQDFKIGFKHDQIGAIPKDVATVICEMDFKVHTLLDAKRENEEGAVWAPCKYLIKFKIEKSTGDYWLALDFGTSATVAAFTNGDKLSRNKEDDLLIDLQGSLRNYVKDYEREEVNEKGTNFLSSELLLRPSNGVQKAMVESTSYNNDIVQLSPTVDQATQNLHLKVPFLKSLIGLDTIPVFYEKLNDYAYHLRNNEEKLTFKDHPVKVETVLSNTYKSLVRDFIVPQIGDDENLNKVIITVPNTFTPVHLEMIRNIILERFPKFRKDYIDFMSESDAVACNYLVNWHQYNFERRENALQTKSEYVLVYDIGAGTTDITYFRITKKRDGKQEVEIIGRLGKATAGNYLDYIIAKIIDQEFNPLDKRFNFTEPKADEKSIANGLKMFIRNYLKPKLSKQSDFRIYIEPQSGRVSEHNEPGSEEFDCSKIMEHDWMKFYFKRNAEDLISEFFQLFPNFPGQTKVLEKGKVPIDTVIFTGRTIQFSGLQQEVRRSIQEWSSRPVYFTPVRTADDLKNVVVKGALQFALLYRNQQYSPVKFKNRNLLARYGFLYRDPLTSKFVFKELLNPSTNPLNNNPITVDGLTIYEYDTDIENALNGGDSYIDMSATATGYFVQSFSSDTAADFNDHNWEYITIMLKFNREDVTNYANMSKVRVRVVVNTRNQMKVSIGQFDDGLAAPLRMDLEDNQTFRQSMWPYL